MDHLSARKIVLAQRPEGPVKETDFRFENAEVAEVSEGQVLVKTSYLSLDPYMRARMDAVKSYAAHLEIGQTMIGQGICEVLVSRYPGVRPGDVVLAPSGWQTHAVVQGDGVRKLDPQSIPVTSWLGILGTAGFAAYVGMRVIGQPKRGETVVVAAASGGVGALVGQLAKAAGAVAVGIAGGQEKCDFIRSEFGFDAALDHRRADLGNLLAESCPKGIDVYFENVGGAVFGSVWPLLNAFGRVPVCGLVGQFGQPAPQGPDRLPGAMRQILSKSLTVRGFVISHFPELRAGFESEIVAGLRSGTLRQKEDVTEGFDQTVKAFMRMLDGRSFGKSIVKLES